MSKWSFVALGEICELTGGNSAPQGSEPFDNGTLPFVRMRDLGRYHFTSNLNKTDDKLTESAVQKYRMKIFEPGCILFPRSGSVFLNHRAILGIRASIVSHIGVLHKFSDSINVRFLYYYLQTYDMTRLSKKTTGVDSIAFSDVVKIEVPLPPLPEQERIVRLLDEAESLRAARLRANERMEQFVPALFNEMFGDITKNTKTWKLHLFGEICESRLGKMVDEKQQTGLHLKPYLRNQNVQWDKVDITNISQMDFDEKDRVTFQLQGGDLLICEGGEVGRTAIWRNELSECYFQKAIHRARPNLDLAVSEYILWAMYALSQSGGFSDFISQSTIAHLTGEKLKKLPVPLPPLALQREFAARVGEARGVQAAQERSSERVEALYQSMLSRAFAGEL